MKRKNRIVWPNDAAWPVREGQNDLILEEKKRLHRLYDSERDLWSVGRKLIAGVDEAGRGPLAGPVVAAAVILPGGAWLPDLDDSKRLSPERRHKLAEIIKARAVAWEVVEVAVEYIDQYNIRQASFEAMRRAIQALAVQPDHLLVDGYPIPEVKIAQSALIRGDSRSASIAAASILAKVTRDEIMKSWDRVYPEYGFRKHKGYATPDHLKVLTQCGPCPIHRRSFNPVREAAQRREM